MNPKRTVGVLVCVAILALPIASGVKAILDQNQHRPFGLAFLAGAALLGALNWSLSIRPALYRRAHGTLDGFKYISGFPALGTVLVVVGSLLGFGSLACAVLGLLALVLDKGGIPWFVAATWRDDSFWGR